MTGRHILARVVLPKEGDAYAGAVPLFGFAYHLEIRRHPDGVEVIAFDGPVLDAYRVPAIDGEAP